jgi:hypothetical protein
VAEKGPPPAKVTPHKESTNGAFIPILGPDDCSSIVANPVWFGHNQSFELPLSDHGIELNDTARSKGKFVKGMHI